MTEDRFNKVLIVISFGILCFSLVQCERKTIRLDYGTVIKCEVLK